MICSPLSPEPLTASSAPTKAARGLKGTASLEPSHTSFLSIPAKTCATKVTPGSECSEFTRINVVFKYLSSPSKVKISFEMVRNDLREPRNVFGEWVTETKHKGEPYYLNILGTRNGYFM